jgi:hypothetical protein
VALAGEQVLELSQQYQLEGGRQPRTADADLTRGKRLFDLFETTLEAKRRPEQLAPGAVVLRGAATTRVTALLSA